jgi:hypothetical protein
MNDDNTLGDVSASIVEIEPSKVGIFFQMAAIVFAVLAIVWGVFIVWSTAFPGPCGDSWGLLSLGVAESWLVSVPVGLFALITGLLVRKGSRSLRRLCFITSAIVLCLPITASILLHRLHCPEIVQLIGPLKANPNLNR